MDSGERLFGATIAAVFRYDGQLVHLVGTRGWSAEALEDARRFYPGPPNPAMLSGRVILSGQAQIASSTPTPTRLRPHHGADRPLAAHDRRADAQGRRGRRRHRRRLARTRRDAAAPGATC